MLLVELPITKNRCLYNRPRATFCHLKEPPETLACVFTHHTDTVSQFTQDLNACLGWYYDLFDTLLRNPQIAGDFGDIACDFGEDHNELFKSEVISIFKSQVISILARVRM